MWMFNLSEYVSYAGHQLCKNIHSLTRSGHSVEIQVICFHTLFPHTLHCMESYGKRQGTLKTTANGERPGESRFAIQCSPLRSPFAAPLPIICSNVLYSRFAIQCSPRRSPFTWSFIAPFVIRHAVRHSSCHSLRRSLFAAPFPVHFLWKASGDTETRQRMARRMANGPVIGEWRTVNG